MAYLKLKNVNYQTNDKRILNNISLNIPRPLNISIIGNSGSGKTTLLKLLSGINSTHEEIYIKDIKVSLENYREIKNIISVVFNDQIYIKESVLDELKYPLINMLISPSEAIKKLELIIKYFEIENIIDKNIEELNINDQILIKILSSLITSPEIICFDNVISFLSASNKIKLFNYLNKEKINYILITNDIEETLLTDYIVCLYNGKLAIEGPTIGVLQEEKLLRRIGFNLPFYIDLSIQLGYYGLLDGLCLTKEDMVKSLWK